MTINRHPRVDKGNVNWIDFNLTPTVTMQEGRVAWDAQNGTLMIGMVGGTVNLQVGQEMHFRAKNTETVTINDGTPVYIESASVGVINIKKAVASDYTIAKKTIGLVTENVAKNNFGYVTVYGLVNDVNTNTWNEGDILYLSDISGELTNVKPDSNNIVRIGIVVTKNSVNGKIFVDVHQETPKFGDVVAGNYSEFESSGALKFSGNAKVWQDVDFPIIIRNTGANIPSISTLQGNLTAPQWAVNNYAVCEGQEIVHQYSEGSTGYWHIHVYTGGTDTSATYLKWEMEYSWANLNSTLPSNIVVTTTDYQIPANTKALTHLLIPIGTFQSTTAKIGGHIKTRLKRVSSTGTAPTNDPYCEMLQMHIQCDTVGSRNIASK